MRNTHFKQQEIEQGIYGKKVESLAKYQMGDNIENVIPGSRFSYITFSKSLFTISFNSMSGEVILL